MGVCQICTELKAKCDSAKTTNEKGKCFFSFSFFLRDFHDSLY